MPKKKETVSETNQEDHSLLAVAIEGLKSVFSIIKTNIAAELKQTIKRVEADLTNLAIFVFVLAIGAVYFSLGIIAFLEDYVGFGRAESFLLLGLILILISTQIRKKVKP